MPDIKGQALFIERLFRGDEQVTTLAIEEPCDPPVQHRPAGHDKSTTRLRNSKPGNALNDRYRAAQIF
ncbi:MAG: hypothetical protein IJ127_20850 [Afipia sp.]|jgi:hypothetical protein|nr:hypothetical protein [Afipia sp.]MBS4006335.1 hypothetical protein [Afipia sp.]WIG49634.1 MAG: hypothetical protein OJF48_000550 [Afipia sp.]